MPEWSGEEEALAERVQEKAKGPKARVGLRKRVKPLEEAQQKSSSNDSGCVTWVIPSGIIYFPANIPGCEFHTWPAGVSLTTGIAHKAEVHGAKALAGSMIDLLLDSGLVDRVKQSFRSEIGESRYFSIIPKDQKPPVDLNREDMEKWRPMMEPFYVKEKVRWL